MEAYLEITNFYLNCIGAHFYGCTSSSMLRYVFLYICTSIAYVLTGLTINTIQILLCFTVKPISANLYKRINYYLCYTYFSLYVFIVDWYAGCELYVYMDKDDFKNYFGKEHSYLVCNHTYEIDWILLLSLADKGHVLGNSKTFCKNDLQYTPGLGFLLHLADYIFLARNFEKDKKIIEEKMNIIKQYPDPVWIILYPEGTRFTKAKHETSMNFAKEKGLPEFKYHLSPRTKGFTTSLNPLADTFKALYDVTIEFKESDENKPKILNLLFGKKLKTYFYIRRIPIEEVPKDDEGQNKFIQDIFVLKDKLRDSFRKNEDFFTEIKVKGVEKMTMKKSYLTLLNAVCWYLVTNSLVLYYLVYLLIAGHTIKFIVCCSVMLIVTYVMNKFMSMSKLNNASNYGTNNNQNQK